MAPRRPPPKARAASAIAADPAFDAAELAAWDRDGVVVLQNAVTRDEAGAIADHLWATVGATPGDAATWYGPRTNGIMVQHFQHPAMDVPRRSPRLHKAFAQLYDHADLIAWAQRAQFQPAGDRRLHLSRTAPALGCQSRPPMPFVAQAILYLTDTAADQGALAGRAGGSTIGWRTAGWTR